MAFPQWLTQAASTIAVAGIISLFGIMYAGYSGHATADEVEKLKRDLSGEVEKIEDESKERDVAILEKLDDHLAAFNEERIEQAAFRAALAEKLGLKKKSN